MKRYMNIDLFEGMTKLVDAHVTHYKNDLKFDKDSILNSAANPPTGSQKHLWLLRDAGTWCFPLQDVLTADTSAHHTSLYYEEAKIPTRAFCVEPTGMEAGKLKGNIFELDYKALCDVIRAKAVPPASVHYTYKDGYEEVRASLTDINPDPTSGHGDVQSMFYTYSDEDTFSLKETLSELSKQMNKLTKGREDAIAGRTKKPALDTLISKAEAVTSTQTQKISERENVR